MKYKLFISYWKSPNDVRNDEIITTINTNITSKLFDEIYIFVGDDMPSIVKSDIVKYELNLDMLSDFLRFIENRTDSNSINVIANSDILFDETLKLADDIADDEIYTITRYEDDGLLHNPTCSFGTSQDCWLYKGNFKIIINNFNYSFFGKIGCDGKFAYDLITTGYKVKNPCKSIKIHHNHKSDLREGSSNSLNLNPDNRLPFPHAFVIKSDINHKVELTDYLFYSAPFGHIRYNPINKTLEPISTEHLILYSIINKIESKL